MSAMEARVQSSDDEARLSVLLGRTRGIVFEFDRDARYLNVWTGEDCLLAMPRHQLLGRTIPEVLGEQVGRPFVERIRRVAATGITETFDYALDVPLGRRWFLADVVLLSKDEPRVAFLARDITEFRSTLKESEERYRQLARATNDVIWDWDLVTNEIRYSESLQPNLRLESKDIGGTVEWLLERIAPDDRERVQVGIQRVLSSGERAWSEEYRLLRGDGTWVEIFDRALIQHDGRGKPVRMVGCMVDVTERNRLKAQLARADRLSSLGQLAAGVAHEMNNPLTYVFGNVSLATERVRGLLERCASNQGGMSHVAVRELAAELQHLDDVLKHAQQGSTRVRQIVRELSCFARADEDEAGALDVRQVLESTIAMSFNEIRHCARLVRRFDEVPLVSAAESRLAQVFLNILLNAAQAIGEGNADDNEIRVTVAQDPNGRVVIEFTDTGPGIAPEVVPHVFDPFFTTKPVGAGTGLGLSICHDIVVSLGGEIQVQSEVGAGATFRVILPPVAPSIPPGVNIRAPAAISRTRRGRILVVDDEPKVARMLRMSLEEEHDVAVVHSGREALALLSSDGSFDLVLCDLMMPDIGGMEVYEHLARSKPELAARIVFVSGGAFTPRTRTFLESVSNPTLDKPFDLQTIRTLVRDRMGCAPSGHLSGGGS